MASSEGNSAAEVAATALMVVAAYRRRLRRRRSRSKVLLALLGGGLLLRMEFSQMDLVGSVSSRRTDPRGGRHRGSQGRLRGVDVGWRFIRGEGEGGRGHIPPQNEEKESEEKASEEGGRRSGWWRVDEAGNVGGWEKGDVGDGDGT